MPEQALTSKLLLLHSTALEHQATEPSRTFAIATVLSAKRLQSLQFYYIVGKNAMGMGRRDRERELIIMQAHPFKLLKASKSFDGVRSRRKRSKEANL